MMALKTGIIKAGARMEYISRVTKTLMKKQKQKILSVGSVTRDLQAEVVGQEE